MKRTLRPMGYAEMLDEVFDIYKSNFWLFLTIALIMNTVLHLVTYNMQGESRNPFGYWLAYPLSSLSSGAVIYAISTCYLKGTPTVISAYRAIAPLAFRLIITAMLFVVVSTLCFMLLIIPGILMFFYLAFTYQVVVLEDIAYIRALKRSFQLVRGHWIRVFVMTSIAFSIVWLIYVGISSPAVYLATGKWRIFMGDQGVMPMIVSFFASAVTAPIYSIASVLLYYDIRVRKEGFDLELLAREMTVSLPSSVKTTTS